MLLQVPVVVRYKHYINKYAALFRDTDADSGHCMIALRGNADAHRYVRSADRFISVSVRIVIAVGGFLRAEVVSGRFQPFHIVQNVLQLQIKGEVLRPARAANFICVAVLVPRRELRQFAASVRRSGV